MFALTTLLIVSAYRASWVTSLPIVGARPDRPALFVADSVDEWEPEKARQYSGLLCKRPLATEWDLGEGDIDFMASERSVAGIELDVTRDLARVGRDVEAFCSTLPGSTGLPKDLCEQICEDACALVSGWKSLCPTASAVRVQLEVFGDNVCARWHQDHFVGRAIVSYNGAVRANTLTH